MATAGTEGSATHEKKDVGADPPGDSAYFLWPGLVYEQSELYPDHGTGEAADADDIGKMKCARS